MKKNMTKHVHERQRPEAPFWARWILRLLCVMLFLPSLVMIVNSIRDQGEWTIHWYAEVFTDQVILSALGRSLMLGFVAAIVATFLGTTAAIVLNKSRWKWRWILETFSVLSLVLPELVFALSLLSWFFILQWPLSLLTVMISHVTFSLAFSLFLVSSRLEQLEESLDHAAYDLGASSWQTLGKVTLPLLKPAIFSSIFICFLMSFDDFLISYFVSGVGEDTLPVKLYTSMKMGQSPKLSALSTLMMLLTLALVSILVSFGSFRAAALAQKNASNEDLA